MNSITCLSRGCLKSSASRSRKTTDAALQIENLILRLFFNGEGKELNLEFLVLIEPKKRAEERGTAAIEAGNRRRKSRGGGRAVTSEICSRGMRNAHTACMAIVYVRTELLMFASTTVHMVKARRHFVVRYSVLTFEYDIFISLLGPKGSRSLDHLGLWIGPGVIYNLSKENEK